MASDDVYKRIGLDDMSISDYVSNGSFFIFTVDSAMFPLETLKTLIITEKYGPSMLKNFNQIVKKEGLSRLYRGLSASLLGSFPGQATYFSTYEYTHSLFTKTSSNSIFFPAFIAGGTAELTAGFFYVPADIVTQRMQMQDVSGFVHNRKLSRSAWDVVGRVLREEGVRGLFRGYTAHVGTFVPGSAIVWGVYEATRSFLSTRDVFRGAEFRGMEARGGLIEGGKEGYLVTGVSGAFASFCSTVLTNPLDMMRIRTQTLDLKRKKDLELFEKGYLYRGMQLLKERGPSVFFRGLVPRLCISVPGSIVAMCGYETVKSCSIET